MWFWLILKSKEMAAWSVLMAGRIFVTETESWRLFEISQQSNKRHKIIGEFWLHVKLSLSFCRGSRVEGFMSRARVPCRGSRVTFFFQFFFSEKVIIDAINVIKTNKNLKNKWRLNIKLQDIPICFLRITFITPRKPIPRTEHVTWVRWIMNFWSNQQEWKEKTLIAL